MTDKLHPISTDGIIGLGCAGLPPAVACAEAGLRVVGFDASGRVAPLAAGESAPR